MVQVVALAPPRNADGDRQTRLRTQVETRGRSCDRWLPLWRSLIVNQGDSEELKLRVRGCATACWSSAWSSCIAKELSTSPDAERQQTLIALEALTDVESWARMREVFGLSFEEACAVWIQAIDRLLPPTPQGA